VRGVESDLGDVDGELREQRGAHADQDVGAEAGGFAGQLALDTDRSAEQSREQKLGEDAEAKRIGEGIDGLVEAAGVDDDRSLPPDSASTAYRDRARRQAWCPATSRRS
jgi:hypothetical protein